MFSATMCVYIYIYSYIYSYIYDYYAAIKKNDIMLFAATWMDLEMLTLSEVRERQISYGIAYMWNKKNDTKELIYKIGIGSDIKKTILWLPNGYWGGRIGRDKLGVWD